MDEDKWQGIKEKFSYVFMALMFVGIGVVLLLIFPPEPYDNSDSGGASQHEAEEAIDRMW